MNKTGGCDTSEIRSPGSQTTVLFHLLIVVLLLLFPFLRSVFGGTARGTFWGRLCTSKGELEVEVCCLLGVFVCTGEQTLVLFCRWLDDD